MLTVDLAIDWAVVISANLANLLLAGMFLARAYGQARLSRTLGTAVVLLAIPLVVAAAFNIVAGRNEWLAILPGLMVLYCAVEFALDYVLRLDFRHTRLLGPYLALYYVSLMGLIGYAFMVGKPFGFVTLATYFANLGATFHSFRQVGHGV